MVFTLCCNGKVIRADNVGGVVNKFVNGVMVVMNILLDVFDYGFLRYIRSDFDRREVELKKQHRSGLLGVTVVYARCMCNQKNRTLE